METTTTITPDTTIIVDDAKRYVVLVEFAFKHLDFQLAELSSVLEMHGFALCNDNDNDNNNGNNTCRVYILPLPNNVMHFASHSSSLPNPVTPPTTCRPFVLLALPWKSYCNPHYNTNSNNSNNPQQQDIGSLLLSRCTLVRSVLEVWGLGETLDDCAHQTYNWTRKDPLGQQVFHRHGSPEYSWKITTHTLGSTFTRDEHEDFRSRFSNIGWQGDVLMKDPTDEYVLIREVALDNTGSPLFPRHGIHKELLPENDLRPALAWYFGRVLGQGRFLKGRGGLQDYSLKKRIYLGPTSMDAELSFVMTSLGQIRPGSMVLDPFVGTGSILLSCACRGAYCVGTDIDIRVLRGKNKDENILSNFRQFNLPRPDLVRSDNALYHRHFRRSDVPLYDAVICDPPYGVRAGARQSGSKHENFRPVDEDRRHDHIAQTKPYPVSDVMADLLDMSARVLVMGGRLVYVIPSLNDFNADTDLPRHDCLEIVHICYQPLSTELGRRIVSMKKVTPYDPTKRSLYLSTIWKNGPASADKCANIRDKLLEAAKKKPNYEERAAQRKEKRKQHKQEKQRLKRTSLE